MKYAYFGDLKNIPDKLSFWEYDEVLPDVVFSFGGDGTMLLAIKKYQEKLEDIIFVGVKKGNLGFFYGFEEKDFLDIVSLVMNKNYKINKYLLLSYNLIGDTIVSGFSLNEVAITNPIHTQIIDVYLNDLFFERFRGTGFIISPPAGSTAYSKSIGGSIIDPTLNAYQLVEIASINNRLYKTISSPLILSSNYTLKLTFENSNNLYISVDGMEEKCSNLKEITISLSNKYVKIVSLDEDFFQKVKKAFL